MLAAGKGFTLPILRRRARNLPGEKQHGWRCQINRRFSGGIVPGIVSILGAVAIEARVQIRSVGWTFRQSIGSATVGALDWPLDQRPGQNRRLTVL